MGHQLAHGLLDLAFGVQRGLEEIHVEAHAVGLQVVVLLVAQRGHGELADRVEIAGVASGDDAPAVSFHAGAVEIGARHVGDVIAAITRLGPVAVARDPAHRTRLH